MDILIVSQYFWPENFRINNLAIALEKQGHKVTILTGLPNYPEGKIYKGYKWKVIREVYKNINIIRVPIIPRRNASNFNLFFNYLSFAVIASILSPFLIKGNIDKIFIYGGSPLTKAIPAIVLKKIKKAPIFLWVLDLWPESVFVNNRIKSRVIFLLIKLMTKWIYKNSDYILLQSKAMYEPVNANGGDYEKLFYFPSWAEDQFLEEPYDHSEQVEVDKLPNGFYITFAGNIGEGQDIETIIDAAEELKDQKMIHWLILGYGSKYEWLIKNIQNRGLNNVHVLGKKPLESMPMYFNFSNVLLASLKKKNIYALTLPGKIQSYMASAKPIIAMIDGESSRILKESNSGISVASEDKKGLIDAVIKLSKMSQEELEEMGHNGREYYLKNFQLKKSLEKLNKLFSDS
jgi:colanic acid biosynthesis glycosyl transferase WcaI